MNWTTHLAFVRLGRLAFGAALLLCGTALLSHPNGTGAPDGDGKVSHTVNEITGGMVCAFITAAEYQQRVSPIVTHSNVECSP